MILNVQPLHFRSTYRNNRESIEKREAEEDAKRIERLKKEGMKLPNLKKRYPDLLDCLERH